MEIEHLRQIVCLSQTLNFNQTARQMFIAQPTLSKHVKSVETALGTPLFIRDGRSVLLTEAGRSFVADAKKVVEAYDEAVANLQDGFQNKQRIVKLGYTDILPQSWKDDIEQKIRKSSGSLVLKTKLCNLSTMYELLEDNQIDIAITPVFQGMPVLPSYHTYKFPRSKLELVCPNDHDLAAKSRVRVEDFQNEQMLVPDGSIISGDPIASFYRKNGFKVNDESQFTSFYEACAFTSLKRGLVLLPCYARALSFMNVTFIPIENLDWIVEPTMIWKKRAGNELIRQFSKNFIGS